MDVQLVSAATLERSLLAEVFTAGYAEYLVPIHVDEARLASMVRWWDIDLDASRVALRDDEPVGLALLGVRGSETWVGGVGVVPDARRTGVGETLMRALIDEARAAGANVVRLEVIRENAGAIALYDRLGFARLRDLEVWSLPGAAGQVRRIALDEARRRIAEARTVREPWQRADGTLENLDALDGVGDDDAAAVVRVADGRVQLLQAAGSAEGLDAVVRSAAAFGEVLHALNVDPADPLSAALAAAGGRVDVTQHELGLEL